MTDQTFDNFFNFNLMIHGKKIFLFLFFISNKSLSHKLQSRIKNFLVISRSQIFELLLKLLDNLPVVFKKFQSSICQISHYSLEFKKIKMLAAKFVERKLTGVSILKFSRHGRMAAKKNFCQLTLMAPTPKKPLTPIFFVSVIV